MIHHVKQGKDIIVGDFIWNSLTERFYLVLKIETISSNNFQQMSEVAFKLLSSEGKIEVGTIALSIRHQILGTPK
jgi:hypothetical protein